MSPHLPSNRNVKNVDSTSSKILFLDLQGQNPHVFFLGCGVIVLDDIPTLTYGSSLDYSMFALLSRS
jgi:hypothetical protein